MIFEIKHGHFIEIPESRILDIIIDNLYEEVACTICNGTQGNGKYECYTCYNGKITKVSDFGKQLLSFLEKEVKLTGKLHI